MQNAIDHTRFNWTKRFWHITGCLFSPVHWLTICSIFNQMPCPHFTIRIHDFLIKTHEKCKLVYKHGIEST